MFKLVLAALCSWLRRPCYTSLVFGLGTSQVHRLLPLPARRRPHTQTPLRVPRHGSQPQPSAISQQLLGPSLSATGLVLVKPSCWLRTFHPSLKASPMLPTSN
ncbi:hypothetical protein B0T25DRAFT_536248 [Lasiosphaeria hispida]|uniref:Secreted protein n=1 Tax=Lasiosphaeria hispida TaxID=260671 RepID=A0AAJ0MJ01_9PEZI|nr:hypothetical protein B0T25DRAFT_536248 [Lasiosphaeria hispida]